MRRLIFEPKHSLNIYINKILTLIKENQLILVCYLKYLINIKDKEIKTFFSITTVIFDIKYF